MSDLASTILGVLIWILFGAWVVAVGWVAIFQWHLWMNALPTLADKTGQTGLRGGVGRVVREYGRVCRENGLALGPYEFMRRSNELFTPMLIAWFGLGAIAIALQDGRASANVIFSAAAVALFVGAWLLYRWNTRERRATRADQESDRG